MAWRANLRLIVCAAGLAAAQPVVPAERDLLAEALALPVASDLVGARHAARFGWVENAAGVRNIWVAAPGRPARQVTEFGQDDGQQLYDLAFSEDGASLVFVRGGDAGFPDDDLPNATPSATAPRQQLFLAAFEGGAPVPIGEGHSPVFAPKGDRLAYTKRGEIWLWDRGGGPRRIASTVGEVRRLAWSPDGLRLLFVDHRDDHSFIGLLDVAGARLRYLDPGLGFSVEPIFSPDGGEVAFIRYLEPPTDAAPQSGPYWSLRVHDIASGASRLLWAAPPGAGGRYAGTRSRNLFWSADGELVFPWERTGWLHAYAIDAAKGGSPRELTPGRFEVETFLLGPDRRSLVFAGNAGDLDRRHIWRARLKGGAAERLTKGDGIESLPAFGARRWRRSLRTPPTRLTRLWSARDCRRSAGPPKRAASWRPNR